jgi:hypothetical protein
MRAIHHFYLAFDGLIDLQQGDILRLNIQLKSTGRPPFDNRNPSFTSRCITLATW